MPQDRSIRLGKRFVEADLALHALCVPDLIGLDQGDNHTGLSGAGGSSRPVDVGLVVLGRVEVNDRCDTVDVDSAGRHVGGNESVDTPPGEVGQCTGALRLAATAVDGGGLQAFPAQLAGEAVRAVAGPTEDDCRPGSTYSVSGDLTSVCLCGVPEHVAGCGDVGCLLADLVSYRVTLVVAGEPGDVAVEGCREQNRLAVRVGLVEQTAHSRHEAHVGHAVGLVEYHPVDAGKRECSLLDQVLKASGACNEDVDAPPERVQLWAVADASVHDSDRDLARKGAELGGDLFGEFTGGSQDKGTWLAGCGPLDVGYQRYAECQSLS